MVQNTRIKFNRGEVDTIHMVLMDCIAFRDLPICEEEMAGCLIDRLLGDELFQKNEITLVLTQSEVNLVDDSLERYINRYDYEKTEVAKCKSLQLYIQRVCCNE